MKKVAALALATAMVMSLFAGCGSKQASTTSGTESTKAPDQKVSLNFMTLSTHADSIKPVVDAFTKENPNINVKLETYPFDQLFQVIEVKMGSNSKDYDLMYVDVPKVAAYTERNYLLPLDNYISADEKKQIIPSALEAGSWKGKFMASPMNTSTQLLFYNKDMLKAAGVEFPSEDVNKRLTWEELAPLAQKVQKANDPDGSKGIMGLMFDQINRPYQVDALPNSLGGKCIGEDGYKVDGVINSPEWVKAMKFYYDVFNTYKIGFKGIAATDVQNYFYSGKIAFLVSGTWSVTKSVAAKLNFGYAPHPYFKDGKAVTPTGSWHVGITKNSAHPEEAAKFIKFMTMGAGNDIYIEKHGDFPSKVAALDKITSDAKNKEFPNSAFVIAAYEAKNTAVPRPTTVGYSEWETVMGNTFEDIRNGEDPKTALDKAVEQINTAFAKYKK